MIINDKRLAAPQSGELNDIFKFIQQFINREVNVKVAMPDVRPHITVQPAPNAQPIKKWRFEFERDRVGRTTSITATALQ